MLAFGCLSLFSACSNEPEKEIVGRKFSSMNECLTSIMTINNEKLDPMTDKPDHVSGFLGKTGRQFNCEVKNTGTEGSFVDGWYEQFKKK